MIFLVCMGVFAILMRSESVKLVVANLAANVLCPRFKLSLFFGIQVRTHQTEDDT